MERGHRKDKKTNTETENLGWRKHQMFLKCIKEGLVSKEKNGDIE